MMNHELGQPEKMKINNEPLSENDLNDRMEAKKGKILLDNTIELFHRELEKLEGKEKALELYQLLLKDSEKLNQLRQELVDNVEKFEDDKRFEIIRRLIEENT